MTDLRLIDAVLTLKETLEGCGIMGFRIVLPSAEDVRKIGSPPTSIQLVPCDGGAALGQAQIMIGGVAITGPQGGAP